MEFPILYGTPSSSDKIKSWSIEVVEDKERSCVIIKRTHGYIDFKMSTSTKEITSGKNIGKKNETTMCQQAINEATSMWKKQKESGYAESKEELKNKNTFLPMLAHDYNKRHKDIKLPCYIQPKLDGVRVSCTHDGKLFSRTGKEYYGFEHIKKAVQTLNLDSNILLDGELFSFDHDFESICSICRKSKSVHESIKDIKFYVFDIYLNNDTPFSKRIDYITKLKLQDPLIIVKTGMLYDHKELEVVHENYIKQFYEGVILRNAHGVYKPMYRSKDLQKYKTFQDAEYKIVDFTEATGNDKGTVIFTCKDPKSNLKFSVRPKGSREKRKYWLDNFESIKGKMLSVKYQNLTEYGIPRFPVGVAIRDYE